MLTFRKGTGFKKGIAAMADHLLEKTLPDEISSMADYYLHDVMRSTTGSVARPRRDIDLSVANILKINLTRTATREEIINLLSGKAADGSDLPGKWRNRKENNRDRITYTDFTFSAPKSLSIAMAFAPTDAEWAILAHAHREAWQDSMNYIEDIIGHARKGKGGKAGSIKGKIGWLSFDHYTSRPTVEIAQLDETGHPDTVIQTNNKAPGDMQTHTHVLVPNVVVCEDGTVGALDLLALHERIHEVGAFYQARLATKLREANIDVELDQQTGMSKLTSIPDEIVDLFSKRTKGGEASAREYAKKEGIDWDKLTIEQKISFLKGGVKVTRLGKGDDLSDFKTWELEAKKAGYQHHSVIRDQQDKNLHTVKVTEEEQNKLIIAYEAALFFLEKEFEKKSVLDASALRIAAARGLIKTGTHDVKDIDSVVQIMCNKGVRQNGKLTSLIICDFEGDATAEELIDRRQNKKVTTQEHLIREQRVISLAKIANNNKKGQLTLEQINRAIDKVSNRDGLDFNNTHGLKQRAVINKLAASGRLGIAIGVAGSGKTTLLRPLIEAWKSQGKTNIYGVAIAYRQSDLLVDAGVEVSKSMAIDKFLYDYRNNKINLDENTVLIIDELSQVGTDHILQLLEIQNRYNFTIIGIGDDKQAQSITAGNSIRLLKKALDKENVPVLDSTVRMKKQRDRKTSLLFREGKAAEGLARLREDGTALLIPGGREEAIQKTADKWVELINLNRERNNYTLTISAPTNRDARDIAQAIRERKRAMGKIGKNELLLQCTDSQGQEQYQLSIAKGDNLRLYRATRASFGNGKAGNIGVNGSVVEIVDIKKTGLVLKNNKGNIGFVKWKTFKDFNNNKDTDPFLLTYGDAITLDAIQSATSTDHIHVMPDGSNIINSFKNYVGVSRSKETTFLIVSDGKERKQIMEKRALGSERPITENDVWENIANNLMRQPDKILATDLLEKANKLEQKASFNMATSFQKVQQCELNKKDFNNLRDRYQAKRNEENIVNVVNNIKKTTEKTVEVFKRLQNEKPGSASEQNAANVSNEENAVDTSDKQVDSSTKAETTDIKNEKPGSASEQNAANVSNEENAVDTSDKQVDPFTKVETTDIKNKKTKINKNDVKTDIDIIEEFADALKKAGLIIPDNMPLMDGKKHRVDVVGEKTGKHSGMYIGYLDNIPAGYIHNFKTGEGYKWKSSKTFTPLTHKQQLERNKQIEHEKLAREAERLRREEDVSLKAIAIWEKAKFVTQHPYLRKKNIFSHNLKIDNRGNLLVPMQDHSGKIWNLQTISQNGIKRFMKGGRKVGTFTTLGNINNKDNKEPIFITEGYATGATIKEVTGLSTVAAFDSGNLKAVATALKNEYPNKLIVIAGDNDHHLPQRKVAEGAKPLKNVGEIKATEAAKEVKGIVLLPKFNPTDKGTDWNDLVAQKGTKIVREEIKTTLNTFDIKLGEQITKQPSFIVNQAIRDKARNSLRSESSIKDNKKINERFVNKSVASSSRRLKQ